MENIAGYSSGAGRSAKSNNDYTYNRNPEYKTGTSTLGMQDYFKLLSAQLQYQDMSNPMSNSEMMAQLTQMAMVEAMNTSTQTSVTTYASQMLNKEVTVAELDETTGKMTGKVVGVVEGVDLSSTSPTVYVNGKGYALTQLMSLGKVPEEKDEADKDDSSGDKENPDAGDAEEK